MFYHGDGSFLDEGEDVGLVYTRDKYGRLHSPPGYNGVDLKSVGDQSYLKDNIKAADCSFPDSNGHCNPQSLFSICLDFVAKNITMVESLEGFPEIVGKQLFEKVLLNKAFEANICRITTLFCDAYGELVLRKLTLSRQVLVVNEKADCIQYFTGLSELDLSHCHLGSSHEILGYISNMQSIVKLNLQDNCLEDSDIAKMTLPLRVMGRGLTQLNTLDLSCNCAVTSRSFKYLSKLPHLAQLNLSGTGLVDVTDLTKRTKLCLSSDDSAFVNCQETKSEGWAVPLIKKWITDWKSSAGNRMDLHKQKDHTLSFYNKKARRNILGNSNVNSRICIDRKCNHLPIILKADNYVGTNISENVCSNFDIGQEVRKRKYLEFCNADKCLKKRPVKENDRKDDKDEEDLLQVYMGYGGYQGSETKRIRLLDAMDSDQWK